MKGTAICFLIGTLSISGCPLLSGFFSKDDIISAAYNYSPIMGITLLATAGLTAFYMFRMYFMTFEGEYRGKVHPHNSSPAMVWPLIALAVPSVCSGWLGVPALDKASGWLSGAVEAPNPFGSFVFFGSAPHFEAANPGMMCAGTGFALVGFIIAFLVYQKHSLKINEAIASSPNAALQFLYQFSFNKWYFDELYYGLSTACSRSST